MKKLRVTVDGKSYEVLVEILDAPALTAAPAAAAPPAMAVPMATVKPIAPVVVPGAAPVAQSTVPPSSADINSPLAGKVVSIDVKVGQKVDEGAQLITIEAMKMNTYIFSPRAGTIAEVLTAPGDGVDEGAVLVRFAL